MEQLFPKELMYTALICGVLTTFVVSAINTIQNKISTNWLVAIVSVLGTFAFLPITFTGGRDIQDFIFKSLLTMSFSILFYNYLGKWFIDTLFKKIKEYLNKISPWGDK